MYGRSAILIIAVIVAALWIPVSFRLELFGVNRKFQPMTPKGKISSLKLGGCEDLVLHAPSGSVYGACAHKTTKHRMTWFPPVGRFSQVDGPHFKESDGLYVIDSATDKFVEIELRNFKTEENPRGLLKAHGISIYHNEDEPNIVTVMVVNHLPTIGVPGYADYTARSGVSIFKHKVGETYAEHVETVFDPLIRTPNDVLALSERSFYVSNDHKYTGRGIASHIMRTIEDVSFLPWTDVILCDNKKCRIIVRELSGANGICRGPGNMILINSATAGVMHIFEQRMDKALSKRGTQQFPSPIDNPSYDNTTNTIYQIGHLEAVKFFKATEDLNAKSPGAVYKVTENSGEGQFFGERFVVRKIYEGEGKLVNAMTVALRVPSAKKMYLSGLYGPTIAVVKE